MQKRQDDARFTPTVYRGCGWSMLFLMVIAVLIQNSWVRTASAQGISDTLIVSVEIGAPDDEGDGMPDDWEQQIVAADPDDAITLPEQVLPDDDFDQDGVSNVDEYILGTNPTTNTPPLQMKDVRLTNGMVCLTWTSSTNTVPLRRSYDILCNGSITGLGGLPTVVGRFPANAASNETEVAVPAESGEQRFYTVEFPLDAFPL